MRTAVESRERSFQFRECLGRGGFGEVYRATMLSPGGLKNEVAVKILRDANADAVRRLRDEGKLLAMLRHPAILRVHDLAGVDGKVALVTEYVEGEDLANLVTPGSPSRLPLRSVVEVVGSVAEALHAAYSTIPVDGKEPLRLVHRDIKPSNVRVGRHGEVKLLDFGIAWSQDADREARTNANSTVGSLAYMAPERFGRSPIRSAADVYSLGCTLYEGVVGERLVPDAVPVEMYRRAADRDVHEAYVVERLALLPADLPSALRELLIGMLAFGPDDRPTAREVANLCERVADDVPGARLRTWCRERDWPDDPGLRGPLTGHTLTEQSILTATGDHKGGDTQEAPTIAQATIDFSLQTENITLADRTKGSTLPMPVAAPPARLPWAGIALLLFVVVAVGLGVGGSGLFSTPESPPPVAGTPEPAAPVEAVVAPEPVVVPEPVDTDVPATLEVVEVVEAVEVGAAAVTALPEPVVEPVVEAPVVVARPPPEPVAAPPGTVRLVGDAIITISLRSPSGASFEPGSVPAGTYEIQADFGTGATSQGRVDVISGENATIRCNRLRYECDVEY